MSEAEQRLSSSKLEAEPLRSSYLPGRLETLKEQHLIGNLEFSIVQNFFKKLLPRSSPFKVRGLLLYYHNSFAFPLAASTKKRGGIWWSSFVFKLQHSSHVLAPITSLRHIAKLLCSFSTASLSIKKKKKKKNQPYNFQLTLVCISHLAVCLIHVLQVTHPKALHNPWRWLTSFSCKKRPKACPKLSTRNTKPPALCVLPQLVSPPTAAPLMMMMQLLHRNHPVCAKVLLPCQPASLIHMAQLFNPTLDLLQVLHHVLLQGSSANTRSTKNQWSPPTVTALLTPDPPSARPRRQNAHLQKPSTEKSFRSSSNRELTQHLEAIPAHLPARCQKQQRKLPPRCQKVILLLQLTNIYPNTSSN